MIDNDAPSPEIETAEGRDIVIAFEAKRCIHARFCVLQQPGVFKANVVGPWIAPDDATTTAGLVATAENCPSGAIQYRRKDGGPAEASPPVNLIRVLEDGPLAFRGALSIDDEAIGDARDALSLRPLEQQTLLRRLAQGAWLHRHRRARDRGCDAARPARRRRLRPPAAQRAACRLRQSRGHQRHGAHDPQGDGSLFVPLRRLEPQALLRRQPRASGVSRLRRRFSHLLVAAALALPTAARADPAPSFWDPSLHLERPDISGVRALRFLTDDDYPPLNFALDDGTLTGFNVEIARAICEELQVPCTIQARAWDTLVDSLETGKGDAVIASMSRRPRSAQRSTSRALLPDARALRDAEDLCGRRRDPAALSGKPVGAVAGSAHEAYLKTFFPGVVVQDLSRFRRFARSAARRRSRARSFADGLTLAVWLAGDASADCCVFKGGPYVECRFFGEGVGIAVRKEDADLRRAMDWALARLAAERRLCGDLPEVFSGGVFLTEGRALPAHESLLISSPPACCAGGSRPRDRRGGTAAAAARAGSIPRPRPLMRPI